MRYININDDKYIILYKTSKNSIETQEELNKIKNDSNYDIIIEDNQSYLFCNKMEEVTIINETK